MVVDNRPGAGGVIGAELAAQAAARRLHAVPRRRRQPRGESEPAREALLRSDQRLRAGHAHRLGAVGAGRQPVAAGANIAEFTALAKANPGKLNYASNGNGSSAQLAAALYESMAGVRMVHVPYKGVAPALTDLMSGEVQLMFGTLVAILPHIKAGKLRALAVTSRNRSALLPDVPTLAESGLPGYEAGSWYGILAPAGTPRAIVARLNAEINARSGSRRCASASPPRAPR